ncbi:helix-turn-helix domain-containing protein [Microbacterium sp. NPDC008134]|uniref:helix-turn-helix domain-containing protein n=1 Tax=Microbacterium sp. NPDC008134 TaxID=3364183 RepID=UPI0036EFB5A3
MDYRYPPNHHMPEHARFGQNDVSPWSGPDDPDPERRAARIQDQASRIVRLRLKADGITQQEFAQRIGMDRPKVSRLLTGAMWASLIDLETLLGGCGATLTSVSLAIGDGTHQSARVKKVISSYLREQLEKVEEETARIEQERPSTEVPQQPEDPASGFLR